MSMTVQQLVDMINLEADELLDQDSDNIQYINNALDFLSFTLASIGDSEALSVITVRTCRM